MSMKFWFERRIEDIKYCIVHYLDNLFPRRYCWADLVMWAKFDRFWKEVSKPYNCSYCGKCEKLGLFKDKKDLK